LAEETVTIEDLRRYMALCGAEHAGPLGVPWRGRPLSEAALAVRATCVKGYYLELTMRDGRVEPFDPWRAAEEAPAPAAGRGS
jgi:hypothetical protein